MSAEQGGEERAAEVRPIYEEGDRVLVRFLTGFSAFVIQGREDREGELWFYGASCCSMMYFPAESIVGRLDAGEGLSWSELP